MATFSLPQHAGRTLVAATATAILAACTTPPPVATAAPPVAKPKHELPAGAVQALAQRFPGLHVVSDSTGLLPTPGVDDIAVVLGDGAADATPDAYTIALVDPDGHGGWRVVATSKAIEPGCAKCSVSADLAPHGLYVRVIRANGADFENFTYQFAPGEGDAPWHLVGVSAYIPARPGDAQSHDFSASVDLVTGQRTDIVDDPNDGAVGHRERQSAVPIRAPIAFGEFSFAADALDVETRPLPPMVFDPAGTLPAPAVAALRERFPQMTVKSQASGSLRGEGRDIVAVLVPAHRATLTGAATDAVVAVLLAQPDGSLRLGDVSGAMAHECATCDVQVQIARRALSVQTTDVNATGSVSVDWQFAFRAKDTPLRLVSVRTETNDRAADSNVRHLVATSNLVSGDRVDVVDGLVDGRRKHNVQRTKLAPHGPVLLADFAFDRATLGDDVTPGPAAGAQAGVATPAADAASAPAAAASAAADKLSGS